MTRLSQIESNEMTQLGLIQFSVRSDDSIRAGKKEEVTGPSEGHYILGSAKYVALRFGACRRENYL